LEKRLGQNVVAWANLGPALLEDKLSKLLVAVVAFAICPTASAWRSRAPGSPSTIAALILSGGLFLYCWFGEHPRLPLLAGAAVFAGAGLLEIWGGVGHRIAVEGLTDVGRREAYRATLAMTRLNSNPTCGQAQAADELAWALEPHVVPTSPYGCAGAPNGS